DAEPIEDGEDALDLGERDGGERHCSPGLPDAYTYGNLGRGIVCSAPASRAAAGRPSSRNQTRAASAMIRATRLMKSAVTNASRRRLKIWTRISATLAAGAFPASSRATRVSAWARNPIAGSAEKIFCQPAVMVTAS